MNFINIGYLVLTIAATFGYSLNLLKTAPSRGATPLLSLGGEALLEAVFVLAILLICSLYFQLWARVKRSDFSRLVLKLLVVPIFCISLMIPKSCWIDCSFGQSLIFSTVLLGLLMADFGNQIGPLAFHFFQNHGRKDIELLFEHFPPENSYDLFKMDALILISCIVLAFRKFA